MTATPPRILVIRRDNIGDLVCTTPLIAALRQAFPQAYMAALVNSYNVDVLAGNPDLDDVFAYDKAKHRPGESRLKLYWQRWQLLRRLRHHHFDWAIVGGNDGRQGIKLARLVHPRHIVAFGDAGLARGKADYLLPVAGPGSHEVINTLGLLQALAPLPETPPPARIYPRAERLAALRSQLSILPGSARRPVIAVHISARKPSQRWPEDRFVSLIQWLTETFGASVVLLWAPGHENDPRHPGDDEKAQRIMAALPADAPVLALPTHTLPELVAALAASEGVVCADGGGMHLAAALGKPIAALFGASDAVRWRPWGVPHRVLQPPSRDVVDVTVAEMETACRALFTDRLAGWY